MRNAEPAADILSLRPLARTRTAQQDQAKARPDGLLDREDSRARYLNGRELFPRGTPSLAELGGLKRLGNRGIDARDIAFPIHDIEQIALLIILEQRIASLMKV